VIDRDWGNSGLFKSILAEANIEVSFNPEGLPICSVAECEYLISERQPASEFVAVTLDLLTRDVVAYDREY
jgi:hypothetical protein